MRLQRTVTHTGLCTAELEAELPTYHSPTPTIQAKPPPLGGLQTQRLKFHTRDVLFSPEFTCLTPLMFNLRGFLFSTLLVRVKSAASLARKKLVD